MADHFKLRLTMIEGVSGCLRQSSCGHPDAERPVRIPTQSVTAIKLRGQTL
ncbi:MAG: hypothetical protein GY749_50365 [Desulfobacteraceae bacterium]|nr:hypothetical protein [Desulfobacteraceae bacterium]